MLLQNIRARIGARLNGDGEAGFTLIELLVVMLILGILAAIALPAFLNQKDKAADAKAKENAHSAQVAMETCATEHNGDYTECTAKRLTEIEETLPAVGSETSPPGEEVLTVSGTGPSGYTIAIKSSKNHTFEIVRAGGTTEFPCTPGGEGGCPPGEKWTE